MHVELCDHDNCARSAAKLNQFVVQRLDSGRARLLFFFFVRLTKSLPPPPPPPRRVLLYIHSDFFLSLPLFVFFLFFSPAYPRDCVHCWAIAMHLCRRRLGIFAPQLPLDYFASGMFFSVVSCFFF